MKYTSFLLQSLLLGSAINLLQADTVQNRLDILEKEIKLLQEQNSILAEEITTIENEKWYASVDLQKSQSGMGAAASKVYYSQNPLSIGGYGEIYYSNPNNIQNDSNGENSAITDVYRFIPYIGYKFNEHIILNSEIEFEHGGSTVVMEFLYIDFLLRDTINIRVGQQLVPMGIVGLRHEPVLFPTVLRPEVETYLIPTTWNELGISAYGKVADFEYQAGIINALNLNNSETLANGKKWIKNARNGSKEKTAINKFGAVLRLDYTGISGAKIGGSIYAGDGSNVKTGDIDNTFMILYEFHTSYRNKGLFFNALYTQAKLDNAKKIDQNATKSAEGFYANIGYNFFKPLQVNMPIFAQYERYNYAKDTASGLNKAKDIKNMTVGINYFPHEQVVFKAEYKYVIDKNIQQDGYNILALGMGFLF